MKDINFYIPDFYYKNELNILLIRLIKEHPECFYNNIKIGAIYGSFPGAIWNGGRVVLGIALQEKIEELVKIYNDLNVPIRFTFTNCLIEKEHLNDTYCNMILKIADNGKNEILVNSPVLEDYIRDKYPNYKILLSTTRCERDVNKINDFSEKYHLVVPDYRDNNNFDFLKQLKHKDKIELLVNAYCDPECKIRAKHYELISKDQLNFTGNNSKNMGCGTGNKSFYDILNQSTTITDEDLYTRYVPFGFNNFKIEGRTLHNLDIIESYIYYLVPPDRKEQVRYFLIKSLWR